MLGCFTYGVMVGLAQNAAFQSKLSNGDIQIALISGTSAGAVQGAILAGHLNTHRGFQGAVSGLSHFWDKVRAAGAMAHSFSSVTGIAGHYPNLSATEQMMFNSGVALLPSGHIPAWIAQTVRQIVPNWDAVSNGLIPLQVNAVRTRYRQDPEHTVFTGSNLTPHAIAASTALQRFGGYRIGNDTYFDGGYHANPHLDGFVTHGVTDLLTIPLCAPATNTLRPVFHLHSRHTKPIMDEIYGDLKDLKSRAPDMRQHIIALTPDRHWNDSAAMNNSLAFMHDLQNLGLLSAQTWLANNLADLGRRDSAVHSPSLAQANETRYPIRNVVVPTYAAA